MNEPKIFTDQLGRKVSINFPPKKIISVVPSQTEFLFDIGLDDEVVGITWFCIHPKNKVADKQKVGGTKNLKIDKIKSLNPDLIIANKEENEKNDIEELAKFFPVWVSDISDLNDSLQMMAELGKICDKEPQANAIISTIKQNFEAFPILSPLNTLYIIWKDPVMSVGNDTFIHFILEKSGLKNICGNQKRYPVFSAEELKKLQPELVLLSSEPFPFKEKHIKEFEQIWPNARIELVDGEAFSWYGSRLLHTAEYLADFAMKIRR